MTYLQYILLPAFFICVLQGTTVADPDFSMPVTPNDYQQYIGQGFSTNYFKEGRPPAAKKYRTQNIKDIKDRGFQNLRLRCRADLYNNGEPDEFRRFLKRLTEVVDECIDKGVAPIISWIHHKAEANATEQERLNYLDWWRIVAETLKDRSYLLSFNLFTELGVDECKKPGCSRRECCSESLRVNKEKYDQWTRQVISTIRATGSNNAERILILASPEKTSVGLDILKDKTYLDSSNQMVEWHEYAAGPSSDDEERPRYWSGNGNEQQKRRLRDGVANATKFTTETGIPTYFGAWMPRDNENGGLNQMEVMSFAEFFVSLLKEARIPWSLNVLDDYYNTRKITWKTQMQNLAGAYLNMSSVLDTILEAM